MQFYETCLCFFSLDRNKRLFSKVLFVFSAGKGLQSADHICRHLQEKRWTKCLQSARRRGFVFFFFYKTTFHTHNTHFCLNSLSLLSLYNLQTTTAHSTTTTAPPPPSHHCHYLRRSTTTTAFVFQAPPPHHLRHLTTAIIFVVQPPPPPSSFNHHHRSPIWVRFGVFVVQPPPPPISLSLYGISLTLSLYGMWWWRWWQGSGGGGGGRDVAGGGVEEEVCAKKRFQEDMGECLCGEEVSQTFFNERSARKQTSCGLQTSTLVCLLSLLIIFIF
ncbi:hypothetical protein HanRHA438_Chr17g0831811 [Helianthus annuus]|nr:hypothetical protein HanRHA438_Chr17g0831811 [Helianthus annuus]